MSNFDVVLPCRVIQVSRGDSDGIVSNIHDAVGQLNLSADWIGEQPTNVICTSRCSKANPESTGGKRKQKDGNEMKMRGSTRLTVGPFARRI